MNAALYLRVSTEEQARGGLSLTVQQERCRDRALQDGCTDIQVFSDEGYSGKSLDRPALHELLSDLENLDVIYAYDQSRLSRSQRDWWNLVDLFAQHEIRIVGVAQQLDLDTAAGRMTSGILGATYEFYLEDLRQRINDALMLRVRSGLKHGRPAYGYDCPRDARGETIPTLAHVIVPERAEAVRWMFQSYARGASLTDIARHANGEGWPGSMGDPIHWNSSRVSKILRNPYYVGHIRYGDVITQGVHEALIGSRLWETVQRRLAERRRVHPRARDTSLASLLRCGTCGGHIGLQGRRDGYRRYQCIARRDTPIRRRHAPVGVGAVKVEAVIWAYVRHLVDGDVLQAAAHRAVRRLFRERRDTQFNRDEERVAELERLITYNLEAARADAIDVKILAEQNEPLLAERDELRQRLAAMEAGELSPAQMRWVRELSAGAIDRLAASGNRSRQRELLGRLFERIELSKASLVFEHRLAGVDARTVGIPAYYAPARGLSDISLT